MKQEGIGIIKQLALNLQMPSLFESVETPTLTVSETVKQNEGVVKFEKPVVMARFVKREKSRGDELF